MLHKKESSSRKRQDLQVIATGALLFIFLIACNFVTNLPAATTQPDMTVWRKTESPLFPDHWPPTVDTVWVGYTFAYGSNPAMLSDGTYVTSPLSKTEWKKGASTTTVLSNEMKQASTQGILPLDDQTRLILENGAQVSEYCLKMTGLPDLNSSETKEMLAYYHAWFKYNGSFLDLIRKNHAEFIDWITVNK